MSSVPLRLGVLAAFLAGWLGAGLHAEALPEADPCGCSPGPVLNSDCGGCERPADHHHHGGGDRHDHAACPGCKAFFLVATAHPEFVDVAIVGVAARPVDAPFVEPELLFRRPARGPPA
jgi:hypothetical protein